MIRAFLCCLLLTSLSASYMANAQPKESSPAYRGDEYWDWNMNSGEGGSESSYLGVDIADVTTERLGALKLNEEHGAEITTVDQDAPAGKAGLHEHDVILSVNGTAIESAAQLRRIIKETPAGRIVTLGISRDGQPMTIKVQLADRHKTMSWEPKNNDFKFDMPPMPMVQDFDLPVSVVVVHQLARSGLMVENITAQLGDFFGVKDGKGVLVRSVEKGSRGDKAGFRAGDVVVKVNNQPVHDTSDFTHAIRSSSGATAGVTVIRDKKEQNLTLALPSKKDSGSLHDDSASIPDLSAETEEAINRAEDVIARMDPAILKKIETQELSSEKVNKDIERALRDSQKTLRDRERAMQELQRQMHHKFSGWAEI